MTVWVTSFASLFAILLILIFMKEKPSDVGVLPYGATEPLELSPSDRIPPFSSALEGLRIGMCSREFLLLAGSFFICGLSTNGLIGTHLIRT